MELRKRLTKFNATRRALFSSSSSATRDSRDWRSERRSARFSTSKQESCASVPRDEQPAAPEKLSGHPWHDWEVDCRFVYGHV